VSHDDNPEEAKEEITDAYNYFKRENTLLVT
jgi:hypothetical protein